MTYRFSFLDIWPYALIFIVFLFCIPYMRRNRLNSWIVYLLILLFTILRYDVGWDYTMYKESIINNDLDRYEPLSYMVFSTAHTINFYPFAFILFGFVTIFLTKKVIDKYSSNTLMSWTVFYAYPQFFLASLSTLRQSLASIIIFYSYKFCAEKKIVPFAICIGIATMFHTSAVVGLLLYPLVRFNINKTVLLAAFILSFGVSDLLKEIVFPLLATQEFNNQVKFYIEMNSKAPTMLPVLINAITIFHLLFYKRFISVEAGNKIYIQISVVGAILFNVLIFEPNTALRISSIFLIFWLFLFPYWGTVLRARQPKLISGLVIIMWFMVSFFFLGLYVQNYEHKILEKISFIPYDFWFNHL